MEKQQIKQGLQNDSKSAIGNASNDSEIDIDLLVISEDSLKLILKM